MNTPLSDKLTAIISPLVESLGLELWGLEIAVGGRSLLRVFVEGPEGADIDSCAKLSRLIGLTLDVEDPIAGPYTLEVSSPGLERTFFRASQLAGFVTRNVDVTLFESPEGHAGRRRFVGELVAAEEETFSLRPLEPTPGQEDELVLFTWPTVRKAKLIHFLPEPETGPRGKKPGAKAGNGNKKAKKSPNRAGDDTSSHSEE